MLNAPARRLEPGRPPGLADRARLQLRARLVRGRLVQLPGAGWRPSGSATLTRICVHYRQRRTGAITRTRSATGTSRSSTIGTACSALVDEYSDRGRRLRPAALRADDLALPDRCCGNAERMPAQRRGRRSSRGCTSTYQRLPAAGRLSGAGRVGGARAPAGRAGGGYRAARCDRAVHGPGDRARLRRRRLGAAARRAARRARRACTGMRTTGSSCGCRSTRRWRSTPRTGTAGYACNPAAIARKAAELAPHVRGVWVVTPRPGRRRCRRAPTTWSPARRAYYRALARARWLVNNVNFPDFVRQAARHRARADPPRHPAEDDGRWTRRDHRSARRDWTSPALMRRADRWDFSVTANAHTTMSGSGPTRAGYETLEVGYPRNDRLALATRRGRRRGPRRAGHRARPSGWCSTRRPTASACPAYRPLLDLERAGRRARAGQPCCWCAAHYFYDRPAAAAGDRRGRVRGRVGVPGRGGSLPGRRRAGHRLLVGDVRLRGAGPADRDLRAGLGRLPAAARRLLRPDRRAAGRGRDQRRRAGRRVRCRRGGRRDAAAARAAFRKRFCYLDDGGAAERVVRRVFLEESGA